MNLLSSGRSLILTGLALSSMLLGGQALADESIKGQVLGGGAPIAKSTVTLWEASAGAPKQIAQTRTDGDGRFEVHNKGDHNDTSLHIIATGGEPKGGGGDNPSIALLTVVGSKPPAHVVVNEMTTVASVWTNAQFLDGTTLKGAPLGLRIAAGNVPNLVDLSTGGWGEAIQGPLNSSQTPTMGNFATFADLLSACVTRITADACSGLFAAATPPAGGAPTNTLNASEAVAHYPWYQPEKLFALLNQFYPVPKGKTLRPVPFMPYLNFAPSAWVFPLKFDGGGLRAPGKMAIDSDGNVWAGDNFIVGSQSQDVLWDGNLTELAPNGRPLSPMTTGYTGGGMEGVGFGMAIDTRGNVWASSYGGQSIAVFDKHGKPLTPPEGITFNGQLGLMQGVMAAPNGDVWVVGISKNQLVHFPGGDWTKGKLICEGLKVAPCSSMAGPFHLAIDQQNRIWVANAIGDMVTRFPTSDPSKVETFKTGGFSLSGLNVDSQGNVWATNRFAGTPQGTAVYEEILKTLKAGGNYDAVLARSMANLSAGGGSVTLFRPDGTQAPGSPFSGPSLPGPWAIGVDGDDQIWVSNFVHPWGQLAHLCGVRTETCPPGMKTGDPISPPLGYVGGGMQMLVDVNIDPAGDVWVSNNWQDVASCFGDPVEALSTRCGGQGVVVFYGMAKPVRTPMIGQAKPQ